MRIAFVGTVEGSLVALEALIAADMAPVLAITLPPDLSARHSDFVDIATPARKAGAEVHLTRNVNAADTIDALRAAGPDLTMVIGWSQICRDAFRAVARFGTLGFHPAPLPRFRGRAVIPWTIIAGETTSGSTLFWLDEGIDSGPILVQRLFDLSPDETARTLYEKHKRALAAMAPEAVALVARGGAAGVRQDCRLASYCAKRAAEDGRIDWREPAETVLRLVRAVGDPYPGAFTFQDGDRVTIDSARFDTPRGRYVGISGQVQTHTASGFTVLCGDGSTIEVTAWRMPRDARPRIHSKFASS